MMVLAPGLLPVGQRVRKTAGYAFPGEVRAVFTTKAGETRYVVEAVGALNQDDLVLLVDLGTHTVNPAVREIIRRIVDGQGYAGMLHIFSPSQIEAVP